VTDYSDLPQMTFSGELLSPERGYTEQLPWGAVRVAGRNRPDTVSNPSQYNVTFKLVGASMVDWFGRWWLTATEEGSLPFVCGIGAAQLLAQPTYSNNTGRVATVSMQLEIQDDTDYCTDQQYLFVGEYFGDTFQRSKRLLEQAINGS
jgi:hypothetical protein